MDQILESSHSSDVSQQPAPLWVAPRGKNRLAPTKKEYSDSMGIDITAYSEIAVSPSFQKAFPIVTVTVLGSCKSYGRNIR
ncbi:hypothetical protein BGX38DRAFT_678953 [Terfezia claveryi]|nr:hypothetical protein BGX38DRAFT_678953 [Terfezia claveryi]